jgi:very-short-patch-repair endonuclease
VVPQYGVGGYRVDFAATHPDDADRMLLAIEADGASYHQSGSVRDRDRLRGEHLKRLGWNFHRVWSTNWFHDTQTEVAKLRAAYEDAVSEADLTSPPEPAPPPPPTPPPPPEPTSAPAPSAPAASAPPSAASEPAPPVPGPQRKELTSSQVSEVGKELTPREVGR